MDLPLLLTAAVLLTGLGIGVAFATLDLRQHHAWLDRLRVPLGAQRRGMRLHGRWRGREFHLALVTGRSGQPSWPRLGVQVALDGELQIERLGAAHRMALNTRWAARVGTGDPGFDAEFVIGSDPGAAPAVGAWCDADRRQRLRRLFDAGLSSLTYDADERALMAHFGDLKAWAELDARAWRAALDDLVTLAEGLPPPARGAVSRTRRSHAQAMAWHLLPMAMLGIGGLLALGFDAHFEPVSRASAFGLALLPGWSAAALFLALAWRTWRHRPDGWRHLLAGLVCSVPIFPLAAYAAVVGLNGGLDDEAGSAQVLRLVGVERRPRDGSFDHLAITAPGTAGGVGTLEWKVPPQLHRQLQAQRGALEVVTRPGWLGLPWRRSLDDLRWRLDEPEPRR